MKIAGIIVNYRTPAMTAQAVSALLTELATFGPPLLWVVDNDSRDGSIEHLRKTAVAEAWGEHVVAIAARRNGGYGYGINRAVEQGLRMSSGPDYYYVLNSDAFVDPGSLKKIVDFMVAHPEAGLVGGNIHGPDGTHQASAFRFPSVLSELNLQARFSLLARLMPERTVALPEPQANIQADWISGTSMLIRRAVFERVGLFDEGFFLYFEEIDFCRRARRVGFSSYCVAEAPITHIGSVSTGMADGSRRMPGYWFDSRHRYFLKHHGRFYTALCDVFWTTGFGLRRAKSVLLGRHDETRPLMLRDFLRSSLRRLTSLQVPGPDDVVCDDSQVRSSPHSNGSPRADVAKDERSARELPSLELLAEDFATYDRDPLQPGFWAVAIHRFGVRSASAPLAMRGISEQAYKLMFATVDWIWGIHLPRTVELGRRVRIWHNGCILLNARSIGDDVHIRHCTTLGPIKGSQLEPEALPVIEARADIGSGACVMGPVTVGHDAMVGANSLVLKHVPPHASVLGVPARIIPI